MDNPFQGLDDTVTNSVGQQYRWDGDTYVPVDLTQTRAGGTRGAGDAPNGIDPTSGPVTGVVAPQSSPDTDAESLNRAVADARQALDSAQDEDQPDYRPGAVEREDVGDPRGKIPAIVRAAQKYGVDPDTAIAVAKSEGLGEFYGDGGKSGGAFQLYTGGGLGNEFARETGLNPLDPKNEDATIDYAMRKVAEGGWGPWHGAARIGVKGFDGVDRDHQMVASVQQPDGEGSGSSAQPADYSSMLKDFYAHNPEMERSVGPVPQPKTYSRMWQEFQQLNDPGQQPQAKYGAPPDPTLGQQIAHSLSYLPGSFWRGISEAYGVVGDTFNYINNALAQDPNIAMALIDPQTAGMAQVANGGPLPTNPNAKFPVQAPGTNTLRTLGGAIPLTATNTPEENKDSDFGANLVSDLSRGAGWVTGPGVLRTFDDVKAALSGGKIGAALWRLVRQPFMGAATYGLGQNLAHDITGENGTPAEQATGALIGAGLDAGRVGIFHVLGDIMHKGPGAFRSLIGKIISPSDQVKDIAQNADQAAANLDMKGRPLAAPLQGPAGMEATGTTLVPGAPITSVYPDNFRIPAAVQTADLGVRALHGVISHNDTVANADFSRLLQENTQSITQGAQQFGEGATREDAIRWLDAMHQVRGEVIDQRLAQAHQNATRSGEAAMRGMERDPQYMADAQLARGAAIHQNLMAASEDIRGLAQAQYRAADEAGAFATPVEKQNVYDAIRAAAGNRIDYGHFPWQDVRWLFKRDPQALLQKGVTPEEVFGQKNWAPGALDTVGQLQQFRSNLLDTIRDQKMQWSQPGGGGDRRLIALGNQIAGASTQEIERATTAAGNNQLLVNANRAFRQWNEIFNSGPLGKLTSFDYEGLPNKGPEQILGQFLATSPTAQANIGRLYDALAKTTGTHPMQALASTLTDAIRQDFARVLNSSPDEGAAAQSWMAAHARLFAPDAPPAIQQLGQELRSAAADSTNLQTVTKQVGVDRKALDQSRLGAFVGADPGKELDTALRGNAQLGMRELVANAQRDPTGAALRGLSQMLGDRMLAEAVVPHPLAGEAGVLSGRAVSGWWNGVGKTAFAELDKQLPGSMARAQKLVNAMRAMDRITEGNALAGQIKIGKAEASLAASGIFPVLAQLAGAEVGRKLYREFGIGGPIQTPSILSGFARDMANRLVPRMSKLAAGNILRDALASDDPTLLRDLLRPMDSPQAAAAAAHRIEPYIMAYPIAMNANAQAAQNPAPTEDKGAQIGRPPYSPPTGAPLRGSLSLSGQTPASTGPQPAAQRPAGSPGSPGTYGRPASSRTNSGPAGTRGPGPAGPTLGQ